MAKKLLKILQLISRDLKEIELFSEEITEAGRTEEPDLYDIAEELAMLEASGRLDDQELDILKSLIVYILMRENTFAKEDVYSLVFGEGRRIIWN